VRFDDRTFGGLDVLVRNVRITEPGGMDDSGLYDTLSTC
jgi:hypothetical protein